MAQKVLGGTGRSDLAQRTPIGRAYNLGTQLPTVLASADGSGGWGFAPPHHPAYMGNFGILFFPGPGPAREQTGPWPRPGPGQAREERPTIPFEQIEFVFKPAGGFYIFEFTKRS